MREKSVIVTVSNDAMKEIESVAKDLENHGMMVSKVMPRLGVISGSVENISNLRNVNGVQSVSEEKITRLPKSGSDVQ